MFEEVIIKVASALKKNNIPYVIIGGQAVLLYGEPRLTRDIDITLGVDLGSVSKIKKICQTIELKILPENAEAFAQETMVLPCLDEKSKIKIDFIFSYTDYEKEAIKRANIVSMKNTQVSYVAKEDLIIHKIFAGRERDIEDIRSILKCNSEVDSAYIVSWLERFDTDLETDFISLWEKIIRTL